MSTSPASREASAAEPEPKDPGPKASAEGGRSSQEERAVWARPSPNCSWPEGRMSS